jgi:hypothetical protein
MFQEYFNIILTSTPTCFNWAVLSAFPPVDILYIQLTAINPFTRSPISRNPAQCQIEPPHMYVQGEKLENGFYEIRQFYDFYRASLIKTYIL